MVNREKKIAEHYYANDDLAEVIEHKLSEAGKDLSNLKAEDLMAVDEFHIGGRKVTLELVKDIGLNSTSRVLDIGSGLGGPARTIASAFGCHVTGIDLTPAFCNAANKISGWVRLQDKVNFLQGDATNLKFEDGSFDVVLTIHAAMNIPNKAKMFEEAYRVLKPNGIFIIYDVLQGEGGEVIYPTPWARDSTISFLATPKDMVRYLNSANFRIIRTEDNSSENLQWFKQLAERSAHGNMPPVTFATFLGEDFKQMAKNQVQNLSERRILTLSYFANPDK